MRGDGRRNTGRGGKSSRYRDGYSYYSYGEREQKGPKDENLTSDTSDRPRFRESNRAYAEDSRISKQLQRMSREDNSERFIEAIEQLKESVMLSENVKYVRRNADYILDCLFEHLYTAPSKLCKWQVALCIGNVGHIMGNDIDRLFEATLLRLDSWKGTDGKVLVLRIFYHLFELDHNGSQTSQIGKDVIKKLCPALERTETMELMVAIVDVLKKIYEINPSLLTPNFQDVVDILVGWHIDHCQPTEVISYVSLSLQSFYKLWVTNTAIARTLLSQFVEDIEKDFEDISGEDDYEVDPSEFERISAYVGAFGTVVRCLGPEADIALCSSSISEEFLVSSLKKMTTVAEKMLQICCEETILTSINQLCFVLLEMNIKCIIGEISDIIDLHNSFIEKFSCSNQLSILKLIKQTILVMGSSLSTDFIKKIMDDDSILRKLRTSPDESVWLATLEVYQINFSIKSVPLLQEAYKFVLQDLQICLHTLDLNSPLSEGCTTKKGGVREAASLLSYLIDVLSDVANTRNSIITMWALKPSLVDLFASYIDLSSEKIACRYPQIQENGLFLLYSHSVKHSHYISSSSLVVGEATKFVPSTGIGGLSDSPPFSTSTSTSENLLTVINLLNSILKLKKGTSAGVLRMCIDWAAELIVGCEVSLPQLMQKKPFQSLISGIVNVAYHFISNVTLSAGKSLLHILKVVAFHQINCSEDIVKLCFYYSNHSNDDISRTYMDTLSLVPLSVVLTTLDAMECLSDAPYNTAKGELVSSDEMINQDINVVVKSQRSLFYRSSSQISASNFHTIMQYLLQGVQPVEPSWLESLFSVNQRSDDMTAEDMKFGALAPHLNVLRWKWMTWQAAQFCITNKLKTTLGEPHDTFTSIENAIKQHAKEAKDCIVLMDDDNPYSEGREKDLLKVELLLEFMEALEKAMFSAMEGSAVTPQSSSKGVKIFFSTNRQTCTDWLSRMRAAVMLVAFSSGQPHIALRHSYKLLEDFVNNNTTETPGFQRAICYCAKSLAAVGCGSAIDGLYEWTKKKFGHNYSWLKIISLSANRRYEEALKVYAEHVELSKISNLKDHPEIVSWSSDLDSLIVEFINQQLLECYLNLSDWTHAEKAMGSIWENYDKFKQTGCLNFVQDLSHIRMLSSFDMNDLSVTARESSVCAFSGLEEVAEEWPLWRKQISINSTVMHLLTAFQNYQGDKAIDINESITQCTAEIQRLLQISSFAGFSNTKMDIIINMQVIYQLKCLLNHDQQQFNLHENWDKAKFSTGCAEVISKVSRYSKLARNIFPNISDAAISKLDLINVKNARKRNSYSFSENVLSSLLRHDVLELSEKHLHLMQGQEFTISTAKIHQEAAKLLCCLDKTEQGANVLANIVTNLNPVLAVLAKQDPSLISLPPNEAGHLCAKSILTLNKWWNLKDRRTSLANPNVDVLPQWVTTIDCVFQQMRPFISEELEPMCGANHSGISEMESHVGDFLVLGTVQCPTSPKIWFEVASWAFRWGKRVLSNNEASSLLGPEDVDSITSVLSPILSLEFKDSRLEEACALLGCSKKRKKVSYPTENEEEEDLRLEEVEGSQQLEAALTHLLLEWGAQSETVSSLIPPLLNIRGTAMRRGHAILATSANAYFKYLKLCSASEGTTTDKQMIATLRLLRLIVKYAVELQDVLQKGLAETPTKPWKNIIPQLFARLSHPEAYVRRSVSQLLCRLAKDFPHLIIFPAVVGASGTMSTSKGSFTDVLDKYFQRSIESSELIDEIDVSNEDGDVVKEKEELDQEEEDDQSRESSENLQRKTLMQNCFSNLVNILKKQNGSNISEVQTLIHELRRITVLWDELWLGTLTKSLSEMSRKCLQLKADLSKLNKNPSLSDKEKENLTIKKFEIVFKPLIFALDHLNEITFAVADTPNEKQFQETFKEMIAEARSDLVSPTDLCDPVRSLLKLKELHQLIQKKSTASLKMGEISPILANMKNTQIAMPGVDSYNEIITISAVGSSISVLPTKTKPKKLSFQGSDGKRYTFLFKGLEDLHLDQRIMQFLATVNTMLTKNNSCERSLYKAHCYSVIPLGPRSGLIQWVGNATPLFGLYKRWQQREAQMKTMKSQVASQTKQGAAQGTHIQRPSELYYNKLTPRLKEAGVSVENRKNWPLSALKEVFKELVNETPSDLLSREMWQASLNSSEWWKLTHAFNISTGVMSIIGYVIGLGDRHLDNLLVNLTTGEVVHIDYNVCFEKGMKLKVPEKVPFRMTQNIEHALGITGVEGVFRSACELVMQTMRQGKETLLTLLEAFIYDPLVDWTPDSEVGYTGAIYGGDQSLVLEAKQSRQRLEKSLTLSMFTVRLAEMKADWMTNKNNMLTSIPNIIEPLNKWSAANEDLAQSEAKLSEGHQLMAMIKEAEASPQHRLYTLISRYKEFTVVKNSIQSVNDVITSNMAELEQWLNLYQTADKFFRKGYIADLRSQLMDNGTLMSTILPVNDHLSSVGQGQLAKQYDQMEGELKNNLTDIIGMCLGLMESVGMYGNIWVNYPSDHLINNRIYKHYHALSSIIDKVSLENVQRIISEEHISLDNSTKDAQISHNEMKMRTKATILNNNLQKIYDCIQEDGSADVLTIEAEYDNSLKAIDSFAYAHAEQGSAAIVCALINSLSQSLSMKLREDKGLAGATSDSLPDMLIGKLWWFHVSYKSLSSIVELVKMTAKYSPPTIPTEVAVIRSLTVLQEVFGAMHDLVLNSKQIIIVEGGRLLWMKEPSVVEVANRLSQFLDARTQLPTLLQQLNLHLHMSIFRMASSNESAVEDANNFHNDLMKVIQQMTDTSFSTNATPGTADGEMNQGQMLLMGFHLLFETIDNQLDRLIDSLPASMLPHPWPRVDSVKHSTEIMGSVYDPSIRDVVRAILKVKKVEAITSFFSEAVKLYSDNNMSDLNGTEEDLLERIVRTYICETICRLLLGLPTYLATHFILIHCQKLQVDVTGYIEAHDVGTEGRVPLEAIVEAALENSITNNNLHPVISTAANLITDQLNVFHKKNICRVWQNEAEAVKILLQRVMSQNLSYQWYYEANLKRNTTSLQLLPTRSATLEDIRQKEANLLNMQNSLIELKEKHVSLIGNVTHRLKWASGSNPSIFEALEEFSKYVDLNTSAMTEVKKACDDLRSLSRAICHFEAMRTTTVEALSEDKKYHAILNEVQESCILIERYPGSINSGEELLISLTLLPHEISSEWILASASFVSDYVTSLTEVVAKKRLALGDMKKSVQSSVDELRHHLSTHHKLMSDIRVLLKSLAKFEQEGEFNGVDGFLCLYKRYSEVMSSIVRQLHQQQLSQQNITFYNQKLQQLLLQTYVIYDKLVEFGSQCREEENERNEKRIGCKKFSLEKGSSILNSSMKYQLSEPVTKKSHTTVDKGSLEHNKYALSVWRRVKTKLEGKDADNTVMPVDEQVDYSIREACNINNLATLYEGWTPWI